MDEDIKVTVSESEDIEELRELIQLIGEEIPGLLKKIIEPLKELMDMTYNVEKARERARAIAAFYKELVDQGVPQELALKLVKDHFINPMSVLKAIMGKRSED